MATWNRIRQEDVDQIRLDVLSSILVSHVKHDVREVPVQHLRFPEPRHTLYRLRYGNPPADVVSLHARAGTEPPDQSRFPWEKGLRLELDIGTIPDDVYDAISELIRIRKLSGKAGADFKIPEARQHLIKFAMANLMKILGLKDPGHIKTPNEKALEETVAQEDLERKLIPSMEKARKTTKVYPKK